MSALRRLERGTRHLANRHGVLLAGLLALLAIYPFSGEHRAAAWLVHTLWALVLVSLVRVVWRRPWARGLVLGFGIPAVALGTLAEAEGLVAVYPIGLALRVALIAVIVVGLFANLLESRKITMDTVLGACCVYLLLGFGWSGIYALIEWGSPGAFDLAATAGAPPNRDAIEMELLYFSLITMTTVGYGDVTPTLPVARMAAAIEAVLAQLYIAIIIARMVSMELVRRDRE